VETKWGKKVGVARRLPAKLVDTEKKVIRMTLKTYRSYVFGIAGGLFFPSNSGRGHNVWGGGFEVGPRRAAPFVVAKARAPWWGAGG